MIRGPLGLHKGGVCVGWWTREGEGDIEVRRGEGTSGRGGVGGWYGTRRVGRS